MPLADLIRRNLAAPTISKYELLFRQLEAFAAIKSLGELRELDLPMLRAFYDSETQGHNTAFKAVGRTGTQYYYVIK